MDFFNFHFIFMINSPRYRWLWIIMMIITSRWVTQCVRWVLWCFELRSICGLFRELMDFIAPELNCIHQGNCHLLLAGKTWHYKFTTRIRLGFAEEHLISAQSLQCQSLPTAWENFMMILDIPATRKIPHICFPLKTFSIMNLLTPRNGTQINNNLKLLRFK